MVQIEVLRRIVPDGAVRYIVPLDGYIRRKNREPGNRCNRPSLIYEVSGRRVPRIVRLLTYRSPWIYQSGASYRWSAMRVA